MTTKLSEINTDSRGEMVCPHCWTQGLVKADTYAAQCENNPKQKILYATGCPNEDCPHHDGGRANPGRVPPDAIKKQYSSSTLRGLTSLYANPRVTGALTIIVIIIAAALMLGPIFGGDGGGTATANTYSNVSEDDGDGNYSSWEHDGWTITETDDGYVVSGYANSSVVYLDVPGNTVDYPIAFDTVEGAEEAISNFETRQNAGNTEISDPEPIDWGQETNWTVYEFGNYSVVAGQINNTTVFLDYDSGSDNITASSDPTLYNSTDEAYTAIVEWETATSTEDSDLETTTEDDVQNSLEESDPLNEDSGSSTTDTDDNDSTSIPTYTYTTCCSNSYSSGDGDSDSAVDGEEEEGSGDGNTVRGSVNDNEGEPVENATIHLYSDHLTTTTDADGEYVFTDVPSGYHHLHVEPPENTTLATTANISFNLYENGSMRVVNETSSSSVITIDGEVVENRIGFSLPTEQPIEAAGTGNDIAYELNFDNARNADDVAVTLTPEYTAGTTETDINSTTGSGTIYIDGNTNPQNSNLTLSGTPGTAFFTENGTGQGTVDIAGNLETTSQEVILSGREETTERAVSGVGNGSIENNGNVDSNATITISGGEEIANSQTASGSGSGAISNDGNTDTTATVIIEGSASQTTESTSGVISDDGTLTIDVGGTEEAQNVQLEVTGSTRVGDSIVDVEYSCTDWGSSGECRHEFNRSVPEDGTYRIDYYVNGYSNGVDGTCCTLDVIESWLIGHDPQRAYWDNNRWHDQTEDNAQSLIYDGYDQRVPVWVQDRMGEYRYDQGNVLAQGTVYTDRTTDEFFEGGAQTGGQTVENYGCSGCDYYFSSHYDVSYEIAPVYEPGQTTASVDGAEVASTQLSDGQTTTLDLGTVEPGEHEIQIDAEGGGDIEYTLSYDEQYETEDIALDAGSDGTVEFERSSPLGSGETAQTEITLQPGETQLDLSHTGPTPGWNAEYTEITASSNVQVDIDNDGINEVEQSVLREDESVTETVEVTPGGTPVTVDSSGPTPTWDGTLYEVNHTENPSLLIGGQTPSVSHNDTLGPDAEIAVEIDQLEPGTTTVEASASTGPGPDYEVAYIGQAAPESATILINGNSYEYPADFSESDQISGVTSQVEVDGLSTGENDVTVSTSEIDGIQPVVTASVEHPSNAMQSSEPTIYVINPSGEVYQQNISDEYITDDQFTENATVELPQEWFEEGRNVVVVQTGDSSIVSASVSGTARTTQVGTFDDTTDLNVTSLP